MKLPADYCAVCDFDGTCISRDEVALLRIVDLHALPKEAEGEREKIWKIYGQKAIEGRISQIEARAWIVESVNLYIQHGLKLRDAYRALERVRLKHGFRRFLEDMHKQGVPVAIISFGIKQFIWYVLQKEHVAHLVSDIFATDLMTWDISPNAAPIAGIDLESIVTPHLKGRCSEVFAGRYGVPSGGIIAIGDSLGDAALGERKAHRICLAASRAEIQEFGLDAHFGEVLVTRSFTPAHEAVLRRIRRRKR